MIRDIILFPVVAASAAAWTLWTSAVAAKNPVMTTFCEFGLIGICWITWGYYVDRKHAEWWAYAVASAISSGFVVWLS